MAADPSPAGPSTHLPATATGASHPISSSSTHAAYPIPDAHTLPLPSPRPSLGLSTAASSASNSGLSAARRAHLDRAGSGNASDADFDMELSGGDHTARPSTAHVHRAFHAHSPHGGEGVRMAKGGFGVTGEGGLLAMDVDGDLGFSDASAGYPSSLSSVGSDSSHGHGHFPAHLASSYPVPPSTLPAQGQAGHSQQQQPSLVTSLSTALSRPLTAEEADRLAYLNRLKDFLATAPSRWHVEGEGGEDPSDLAQITPTSHPALNRFLLPTQEYVSPNADFSPFGLQAFSRPVRNMQKFEEGVYSDLRNLKPGVDACLEEPKSPFLDLLFKYQCIRTQKKQKVFYWFSVPHNRLFLDALERDLKREKMGLEPTTQVGPFFTLFLPAVHCESHTCSLTPLARRSPANQPSPSPMTAKGRFYEQFVVNRDGAADESSAADSRNASVSSHTSRSGEAPRKDAAAPFFAMFSLFEGPPTYKERRKKSGKPLNLSESGAPMGPNDAAEERRGRMAGRYIPGASALDEETIAGTAAEMSVEQARGELSGGANPSKAPGYGGYGAQSRHLQQLSHHQEILAAFQALQQQVAPPQKQGSHQLARGMGGEWGAGAAPGGSEGREEDWSGGGHGIGMTAGMYGGPSGVGLGIGMGDGMGDVGAGAELMYTGAPLDVQMCDVEVPGDMQGVTGDEEGPMMHKEGLGTFESDSAILPTRSPTPDENVSTFVVYSPSPSTSPSPRNAILPEDLQTANSLFPENEGQFFSVHSPNTALQWTETHHEDDLLVTIRKHGLGGPLPAMFSPDVQMLVLFGSILDDWVQEVARLLADVSKFPVMIQPLANNPVRLWTESVASKNLHFNADEGQTMGTFAEINPHGYDFASSASTTESEDNSDNDMPHISSGGVFRLRGGADDSSSKYIPRLSPVHNINIHLEICPAAALSLAVKIYCKLQFKIQHKYADKHRNGERPQAVSWSRFLVAPESIEVVPDRSYSTVGFFVRERDISFCESLPCEGFIAPRQILKTTETKTRGMTGTMALALSPNQTGGPSIAITRTNTNAIEKLNAQVTPKWEVKYSPASSWKDGQHSYNGQNIVYWPSNWNEHPLDVEFSMGINFVDPQNTKNTEPPSISFIIRNQTMLWIHNDSLKAKGQGIIILTSSYIPDIETQDELYISENETVDLVQGPSTNPVINEDAGPNQVHFSLAAVKSPKEEKPSLIKKISSIPQSMKSLRRPRELLLR
ncbi:hypothetical protein MSAN_01899600 [Mycena sanguinolenta]|uniref:Uncharacterized protein n=1 Tax=Mycena sanguinolenta TaxID=230812 RepID=A0A8H6XRX8_9AGAR|nr:hypothetical protein MSAN_01899600 [Mycena sanguinolenta]